MLEPLVKTIEVPCNQKKAFTVFMDMGSWWPKDKFATSVMRGQSVKALRVDAREGGQIVEVASDGREQLWARSRPTTPTAT